MADEFEFFLLLPRDRGPVFTSIYKYIRLVTAPTVPFPVWEQFVVPLYSLKFGCDCVHHPYNTGALLNFGARSVVTVHDLTFQRRDVERDWKSYMIHAYMRLAFKLGTRRANKIISVSETTKHALSNAALESTVVYNTVESFVSLYRNRVESVGSQPYFLHRGSLAPEHRNTARVIKAFLMSDDLRVNYRLKVLGVPNARDNLGLHAEDPVDLLTPVSDRELANLYFNCTGLVAASIVEGFCLPIIEAFGFGAPVVTSNLNPMLEIASDAALIVDPYNLNSLQTAMLQLAADKTTVEQLRVKGHRRYQDFSVQPIADKLRTIYNSAGGRRTTASAEERHPISLRRSLRRRGSCGTRADGSE